MTEEEKKKQNPPTEVLDDDFDDEEELDVDDIEDNDEDEEVEVEKPDEDEEDEEESKSRDDEKKAKEQQDKEERARQAQKRREREAKEREAREKAIKDEAYLQGQLDGIKVNPFTEEPIEDKYDLEIYKIQLELQKEGKDPIADLPKRQAELARKKAKEAEKEATAKKQLDERVDNEFKEFGQKYPNVNVRQLLNDPDFKDYAEDRLGVGDKTLTQIYEAFTKLKQKLGGKKEGEEEDDGIRTPPSPNGGRKTRETPYSKMSEEDKIKELKRQGLIN